MVWTLRALAVRAAAYTKMIVLDEPHNAGGGAAGMMEGPRQPGEMPRNLAEFFRDLVKASAVSVFSSATYAKNPTVLFLYALFDLLAQFPTATHCATHFFIRRAK